MSTLPPEIKLTYPGSDHPIKAKNTQNKTNKKKTQKTKTTKPPRTLLKDLFSIPKARVTEWIRLFKTYTFFRHRFKSAPLFLPHKRKANLCLMVNNFWQLLPFKVLQGQDDYLERQITDHLDRRLCHVDPLWSLILNSDYILIVQATFVEPCYLD